VGKLGSNLETDNTREGQHVGARRAAALKRTSAGLSRSAGGEHIVDQQDILPLDQFAPRRADTEGAGDIAPPLIRVEAGLALCRLASDQGAVSDLFPRKLTYALRQPRGLIKTPRDDITGSLPARVATPYPPHEPAQSACAVRSSPRSRPSRTRRRGFRGLRIPGHPRGL
jgi:hypothetical protein